ncbi:hypothetical protein G9A89_020474 [Geosiphon pyriformis]|nr:hypothetical protein G9A89_020474 [Geosiphon pyriformis]
MTGHESLPAMGFDITVTPMGLTPAAPLPPPILENLKQKPYPLSKGNYKFIPFVQDANNSNENNEIRNDLNESNSNELEY